VSDVESAVAAIRAGKLVLIPTDTVYGLAGAPYTKELVRRLSALKGRPEEQPTALVAASVDVLLECVPELRGRTGVIVRALLPGPYTLVLPNPAQRFRWLTPARPDTIGVRVPALDGPGLDVLTEVGVVAASSANKHGSADPCRLEDVHPQIRAATIAVDGGELSGIPSTVLDLTGREPRVLREGAVTAGDALRRVAALLAE
jgi:L-threonylcarbamoyladenylate synthase